MFIIRTLAIFFSREIANLALRREVVKERRIFSNTVEGVKRRKSLNRKFIPNGPEERI